MSWFRNLSKFSATNALPRNTHPSSHISPRFTLLISRFSTAATGENQTPVSGSAGTVHHAGLAPTKPHEKPRVVVLGTGWAGCRLMKGLDPKIYDIVCVSPRNHMVFTPLLASTCVGTLEFRSVAEPIARIQPAISKEPGSYFFLANCTAIDPHHHMVCELINELELLIDMYFLVL